MKRLSMDSRLRVTRGEVEKEEVDGVIGELERKERRCLIRKLLLVGDG